MTESILEILLKAQKYVESKGGRLSARIVVWPFQIVNILVDYERIPNKRAGGFGVAVRDGDLGKLQKELEQELDYLFGSEWRRKERDRT
jgi:hypothetical protein